MSKCLYCDNEAGESPHFQSGCCERGMCEDCYSNLAGTDEQLQLSFVDDETYQQYSNQINEAEKAGFDYLCFECLKTN